MKDWDGAMVKNTDICKEFDSITSSIGLGTLLDYGYEYGVVIVNYIARVTFIYFASLIRF